MNIYIQVQFQKVLGDKCDRLTHTIKLHWTRTQNEKWWVITSTQLDTCNASKDDPTLTTAGLERRHVL